MALIAYERAYHRPEKVRVACRGCAVALPKTNNPGTDQKRFHLALHLSGTSGGLHLVDVSTFTVGVVQATIKRLARRPKSEVEDEIDSACSIRVATLYSLLRDVFGPDARVIFVLDGGQRHELKRETVRSRMIGAEVAHLKRVERGQLASAKKTRAKEWRRAARKEELGLEEEGEEEEGGSSRKRAKAGEVEGWSVTDLRSPLIRFPVSCRSL